jgi:SPP1 gp7 family putative phage head morphogenesis protein
VSANGYLIGATTRHQILIQRLAAGYAREVLPALRKMQREIRAALLGHDLTSFQTARLTALSIEIAAITQAAGVALEAQTIPNMQEFVAYEAQFTQKMLQGAVTVQLAGVNTTALAKSIPLRTMTLVSGKKTTVTTMAGMFDTFAAGVAREVETAVVAGITQGLTTDQITAQVSSMVGSRSFAQAKTVVVTATNQAGSIARNELYAANSDVLEGEEWVATLDSVTRIEHAVLDGQVFQIGEGPQSPLGYNCRCLRVPRVNPAFADLRAGATRASMTGPVSSQKTFAGFFADQGADFQREFLGPERYDLYKSGEVSFKGFADQSGRVYTLDELKSREGLTL